jgi:hypothetical protein
MSPDGLTKYRVVVEYSWEAKTTTSLHVEARSVEQAQVLGGQQVKESTHELMEILDIKAIPLVDKGEASS